jgi:hypothetical protein
MSFLPDSGYAIVGGPFLAVLGGQPLTDRS